MGYSFFSDFVRAGMVDFLKWSSGIVEWSSGVVKQQILCTDFGRICETLETLEHSDLFSRCI